MYFADFKKKIDTLRIFKHTKINKIVISALKCGNRFMEESNCFDLIKLDDITMDDFKNAEEIFWIIREPQSHFISALITELQVRYNSFKNPYDSEENWILELIENKLLEIIEEPKFSKNFSHYQPRYQALHSLLKYDIKYFYKSKFIELKNLSNLVETEFKCDYVYIEDNYSLGFGIEYPIDKNVIIKLLETKFKSIWEIILQVITIETEYYKKLNDTNIIQNFVSRIDVLDDVISNYIQNEKNLLKEIKNIKYTHLEKMKEKDEILHELNARLGYGPKTLI
jgi:hypothetical protein